jgi:hypothetical protein
VIDRIEENGAKLAFTWESFRKKPWTTITIYR